MSCMNNNSEAQDIYTKMLVFKHKQDLRNQHRKKAKNKIQQWFPGYTSSINALSL